MACSYCKTETHTWTTPDDQRICFNCLRQQRDAAVAEVAALKQAAADLSWQIPPLITDLAGEREEWEKSLAAACQRINASEEANRAVECRAGAAKASLRDQVVTVQEATARMLEILEFGP